MKTAFFTRICVGKILVSYGKLKILNIHSPMVSGNGRIRLDLWNWDTQKGRITWETQINFVKILGTLFGKNPRISKNCFFRNKCPNRRKCLHKSADTGSRNPIKCRISSLFSETLEKVCTVGSQNKMIIINIACRFQSVYLFLKTMQPLGVWNC